MAQADPPAPEAQARGHGRRGRNPGGHEPGSGAFRVGDHFRPRSLLGWPVLLFLVLICVPPIALVILGANPTASTFDHVAWIFAVYFGLAWLLLLGIIIRPHRVTRPMLVLVTAVALAYRRRKLTPRDYLFLGAVSGLVFGASEVVMLRLAEVGVVRLEELVTDAWRMRAPDAVAAELDPP